MREKAARAAFFRVYRENSALQSKDYLSYVLVPVEDGVRLLRLGHRKRLINAGADCFQLPHPYPSPGPRTVPHALASASVPRTPHLYNSPAYPCTPAVYHGIAPFVARKTFL